MPLRLLLDGEFAGTDFALANPLTSKQVLLAGLRDTDPPEDKFLATHRVPVITAADFTVERVLHQLAAMEPQNLYVHLDLNILDPREFPWLMCPVAGGIPVAAVAELLDRLLRDYSVVGLSLTETTATEAGHLTAIQPLLAACGRFLAAR